MSFDIELILMIFVTVSCLGKSVRFYLMWRCISNSYRVLKELLRSIFQNIGLSLV